MNPENTEQAVVIVPTVGNPALVLPCVQRLIECTTMERWKLILAVNAVEAFQPSLPLLKAQVEAAVGAANQVGISTVELDWLDLGGPKGWTGAVNAAVEHLIGSHDRPGFIESHPHVVVMNDDVLVTTSWLDRMVGALDSCKVQVQGETIHGGAQQLRDVPGTSTGMVGPVSNIVGGVQRIGPPSVELANGGAFVVEGSQLLDRFAMDLAAEMEGVAMEASFLSGLCVLYRGACLWDLSSQSEVPGLLDPAYGVGGYDDNDVSARATRLGWRMVVDRSTYVHHIGHQTLDTFFPETQRGMANVVTFMQEWEHETKAHQTLGAVYRVKLDVPWDANIFTQSVVRTATITDSVTVLLTGDPRDMLSDPKTLKEAGPAGIELLNALAGLQESATAVEAVEVFDVWLKALLHKIGFNADAVLTSLYEGEFNERDERNQLIALACCHGNDWLISVDHDEILEGRVQKAHMQRLMAHPNPLVSSYDFGWVNHWDTPRLARVDKPWCHGYNSSMRGFRMWRVAGHHDNLILAGTENGLHCGNIPDFGESAKRVANLRFRHYGYLRPQDRIRKWKRYQMQDPDPDGVLTQATSEGHGSYDHLVNEEGMQLQPFAGDTSIGLTMLWHSGESALDLYRMLDQSFGIVDRVVLVWTEPEDQQPPEDVQYIAARFGARWVHHPLEDDLGTARNAGVDALRGLGCDWCWVMDPDEHLAPAFPTLVSIRRLVEVTNTWAWMFRFRNHRPGGTWNMSENTRLFRLAGGKLRFSNRVHETLERALQDLASEGVHPQVRFAPFLVDHYGLAGGDERTQAKLQRYTRLLVKQIQDHPLTSPGAWVSLGLQFGNDGMQKEQWACYTWAMQTSGNAYLPWREAALYHLRLGRKLLDEAVVRLVPSHALHAPTAALAKALAEHAPDQPTLGAARQGTAIPTGVDLGALIAHAGAALDAAEAASDDELKEE